MAPFIGSCRPEVIVREALDALGLSFHEFRQTAKLRYRSVDEMTSDQVGAYEWMRVCSVLHLNMEVYSFGFSRRELARGISAALGAGSLKIRITPKLKKLVAEERRMAVTSHKILFSFQRAKNGGIDANL